MRIILEAQDIAAIVQEAIRQQYKTPNVSITDTSLRKIQKIKLELQVVPVSARAQNMTDTLGDDRMRQLAQTMQGEGNEAELIAPSLDSSGL